MTETHRGTLLAFYRAGQTEAGSMRASNARWPHPGPRQVFMFRVEHAPSNLPPGAVYRLSDVDLASRLSFFLWSSIPN